MHALTVEKPDTLRQIADTTGRSSVGGVDRQDTKFDIAGGTIRNSAKIVPLLLQILFMKTKDYFGLKCILSYYVPVQTIVSPYDAPLIYPTTDIDFLFGIIVSFDLSFYFFIFLKPAHNLFVNGIIRHCYYHNKACTVHR